MRVVSLGSGSSGNALLIEAGPGGRTRLLVDAGFSLRQLTRRLQLVGVSPAQLQGVLVTHEHSDHVMGIAGLVKNYSIPVVANQQTLAAVEEGMLTGVWSSDSGKMVRAKDIDITVTETATITIYQPQNTVQHVSETTATFGQADETTTMVTRTLQTSTTTTTIHLPALHLQSGRPHTIGDITVTAFPISHDAVAPSGYLLQAGGCRVCIVTDTGEVTPTMLSFIQQADLLILEANHDREKLLKGPYPWPLKKRILSSTGHLSNAQAAEAIFRTWPETGSRWLWLAHLSRTNNTPALASASVQAYLQSVRVSLSGLHIHALPPGLGPIWDSTQLWQF